MIVGPIGTAFLTDKVLRWKDALHYLERKLIEMVTKIEFLSKIRHILIEFYIDGLEVISSDLVQTRYLVCRRRILCNFSKCFLGPAERRNEIPL